MVAFVTANYLLHSSFLPQVKVTRPAGRHAMLHSRVMKASRPITMKSETGEKKESPYKKLEENVQAKKNAEYRGPQGFTPYAELVNG